MLMACNKGHLESVFVLYEAGFCIVSQLGQTGRQFNVVNKAPSKQQLFGKLIRLLSLVTGWVNFQLMLRKFGLCR